VRLAQRPVSRVQFKASEKASRGKPKPAPEGAGAERFRKSEATPDAQGRLL
jgi:hypothetical protein